MKSEMVIKVTGWVMLCMLIISVVSLIIPMVAYQNAGVEIMSVINFGCASAIATIAVSLVYFASIAIDWVRAWKEEKLERAEEAEWEYVNS